MAKTVTGYSAIQVTLHWIVVVLVAFQFLAHDAIEDAWRASQRGEPLDGGIPGLAYMHVGIGLLVLALALARIALRITRGAPSPPADEPWILKISGEAVHGLIYVLLILLPVSGLIAWFAGSAIAGEAHEIMKNVLLAAIALHIAGALFQHFVRRSDVLIRMFKPDRA